VAKSAAATAADSHLHVGADWVNGGDVTAHLHAGAGTLPFSFLQPFSRFLEPIARPLSACG